MTLPTYKVVSKLHSAIVGLPFEGVQYKFESKVFIEERQSKTTEKPEEKEK